MAVGGEWNVDAVEARDLFLPVRAPDGRLDHDEVTRARVPLKFHTAHSLHAEHVEGPRGHRVEFCRDVLGGGRARCGAAGPRRPAAKLATGEGGDGGATGAAVLQTEVDVGGPPLDPFLDDE